MEELTRKMQNLIGDNSTVKNINAITYTNFDGRTETGTEALVYMGADLGTLNPNE